MIKQVKNIVTWTYVINNLNGEEIFGTFYEKELQKLNQKEFRIEKEIKKKGNKIYVRGKDMIIHLIKNAIGIGTSKLALKSNLASLKAEIDKIDEIVNKKR